MKKKAEAIDRYIGGMLRAFRRSRGWTQGQAGKVIGVSYQQIQKYETGQNRLSAVHLLRLSIALNLPIYAFLPNNPDDPWEDFH